jgi:cellulose synthase (UDP-forming)
MKTPSQSSAQSSDSPSARSAVNSAVNASGYTSDHSAGQSAGGKARSSLVSLLVDGLPRTVESGLGRLPVPFLWLIFGLLLVLSVPLIVTTVSVWQQTLLALVMVLMGWGVVQLEQRQGDKTASEYLHLLIIWFSAMTTLRYLYYRTSYTLKLDNWVDGVFSILLYAAELYAIMTLFLSYFQTLKLRDRKPVDLAVFPQEQWPNVDIYIPTYSEDVSIVRKTALGALAIDYPEAKKRVYILDDGRAEKYRARREKLRQMCEELGCEMITRDNNDHAKAGNINNALTLTQSELVLILDCDHIPSRQFLKHTVGFFFDTKVALVQTPHWFYNPDPFERNLLTGGRVPVGNELFYKVLQKGNDFWNAAFFCGSAAVIRRDYVLQVGGIAVETVTEDCHTSFRLHSLGYKSVYYDKIMIAGLAPEKFSSYVGQQVRWARGMAQILRLENPLINPKLKLSLAQRLCYFSATSHFFYGFPRLMYAIAPTLFLLFSINPIKGLGLETLAYALPHIVLSTYANFIPYKNVRFSFWNEIYEFAMSFQAGIVTFLALINPKLGDFNVTNKGETITEKTFDWQSSRALVVVTVLVLELFQFDFVGLCSAGGLRTAPAAGGPPPRSQTACDAL